MLSVFLAHAPADARFFEELSAFLEIGCDGISLASDATIPPGQDLLTIAETVSSEDVLVLLLSPASNPLRWSREIWEPLLRGRTRVSFFLLEECTFPLLLRRGSNFFDATSQRLAAMRQLKRWIWGIRHGTSPAMALSPDLEALYRTLADQSGTLTASGPMAERFAQQAGRDFEAVFWVSSHGRTLAQIAGDLGSQLGMTLDGPVEDNCRRIGEMLSGKRCLVVLDAPQVPVDAIMPTGRTSFLFTDEPVQPANDMRTLAAARALVSARRYAEAYEVLYELFYSDIEPESCARELVWICEHWDQVEEANAYRFSYQPVSSEQLRLF